VKAAPITCILKEISQKSDFPIKNYLILTEKSRDFPLCTVRQGNFGQVLKFWSYWKLLNSKNDLNCQKLNWQTVINMGNLTKVKWNFKVKLLQII
jgi:hypothetical protein